jgi:hypothetical protein
LANGVEEAALVSFGKPINNFTHVPIVKVDQVRRALKSFLLQPQQHGLRETM